jgi:hypothetical protein
MHLVRRTHYAAPPFQSPSTKLLYCICTLVKGNSFGIPRYWILEDEMTRTRHAPQLAPNGCQAQYVAAHLLQDDQV